MPARLAEREGIRLSCAIMTHPGRAARAQALAASIHDVSCDVVIDPDPGAPGGSLRTAILAWGSVAAGSTHHLVIQDDAIIGPGLIEDVLVAANRFPSHALCFFTEWGSHTSFALRIGALAGCGWTAVIDDYIPSVVLLLPASAARAFSRRAAATATAHGPALSADDRVLRRFLDRTGVRPLVSIPNLVDHAGGDSLDGNDEHGERRAACPILARSARSWIQHRPVLDGLQAVPYFSITSGAGRCLRWRQRSGQWESGRLAPYLAEMGADWAVDLSRTLSAACGRSAPVSDLAGGLPTLENLMLVAIALGLAAAGRRGDTWDTDLSDEVLDASVTSLAGCLRRHAGRTGLDRWAAALRPLLHAAVQQGARGRWNTGE